MLRRLAFTEFPEKSLKEFQEIYLKETGEEIGLRDANQLANDLYHLFDVFDQVSEQSEERLRSELTDNEIKALNFIEKTQQTEKRTPTVRDISAHLGFKSSRTGHKILLHLKKSALLSSKP